MVTLLRFLRAAALLAAGPAAAQATPAAASGAGSIAQMLLGLLAVIAVLLAALWLLKRLGAPRAGATGLLRVIATSALGPRERVVVIEVSGTWLVVGVAPGRINALHQMPRPEDAPVPQATPAGKDFSAWLRQFREPPDAH